MANHGTQLKGAVTLPKEEYARLKKQAQAYRALAAKIFELSLRDSAKEVAADFRATDLYTEEFLADMEDGLRRSSYSQKHANQTAQKRSQWSSLVDMA